MDTDTKLIPHGPDSRERVSALLVAIAVTFLIFAGIGAGFTPHGADLAGRALGEPARSL